MYINMSVLEKTRGWIVMLIIEKVNDGPALRTTKKHILQTQGRYMQRHKLFSPLMHMNSHSIAAGKIYLYLLLGLTTCHSACFLLNLSMWFLLVVLGSCRETLDVSRAQKIGGSLLGFHPKLPYILPIKIIGIVWVCLIQSWFHATASYKLMTYVQIEVCQKIR